MRQHFNNLLKVSTLKTVSGQRKSLIATATADATIQPLGKGRETFDASTFGKTYVAYVEEWVPVKKGDRATDRDGNVYDVQDVVVRDFGAFPYQELILKRTQ